MNVLVDPERTSSTTEWRSDRGSVALASGLLLGAVFGTGSGVSQAPKWRDDVPGITTMPAVQRVTMLLGIADEVRQLRDRICSYGLTRQDIAHALRVDRRSLSGWVSGEIRPTSERVLTLNVLADLVADVDAERPGRARDVLLARRTGRALLDRVAAEGRSLLVAWRLSVRPEARVEVRRRTAPAHEPIWAAAARALAEGQLAPPTWERTVRTPETYEIDLEEATAFREEEPERGRRGYR
jgi:transcriptional regulator with XRE-family HTH domain